MGRYRMGRRNEQDSRNIIKVKKIYWKETKRIQNKNKKGKKKCNKQQNKMAWVGKTKIKKGK